MTTLPAIDLGFYHPHKGQQEVHASTARVKVIKAARRWGKSRAVLFELLRVYMEALRDGVSRQLVPPFHAWVVCPSFPQAAQTWAELLAFVPEALRFRVDVDSRTIYLRGTQERPWGIIEIKSAHNENALQTVGLDFLWVNEAQDVSDAAFQRLLPTIRSPERLGKVIYEGIPSLTADHWFERMYGISERGREGFAAFHYTVYDNPLLTREDLDNIELDKELLPEAVWRRMYLAEFSSDASGLRSVDTCIAGDLLPGPIPGVRYVAGLDLGRVNDATVLTIMDAAKRRVAGHYRWDSGENWTIVRESVIHFAKDVWGIERLVSDATGVGDIFASEMLEAGLPVEPVVLSAMTREPLLTALAVAIERGNMSYPNIPSMLRELHAIQHRKTGSRTWRLEAPPGYHDDEVFALALALSACDPPAPVVLSNAAHRQRRYAPTQEEAENGVSNSFGARFMRERRRVRFAKRWDIAKTEGIPS